ncbi:uncharacterized protein LOC131224250 [Magnolia sinica]|uniref:uncharacterized protein LOC131224250 n=1 Tax=Magnolia sinica TaxID=86752 RepID=UPI002658C5FB|nr:uncharacterized protein LOC131224250 [Magnolia sinica]
MVDWTEECEAAFQQLKSYLGSPSLPLKPELGEALLLYLAVSDATVSLVLIREHEGKQLSVYYVSKTLLSTDIRYPLLKKVALVLKPEAFGRLMKWAIELSEFDIQYKPRVAIKGQAVAYFITEVTPQTDPMTVHVTKPIKAKTASPESAFDPIPWKLYVDGSSNSKTRKEQLKAYMEKVKELINGFQQCVVTRIPRTENTKADLLAKLASADEDNIPRSVPIEYVVKLSINEPVSSTIQTINSEPTWLNPIVQYLDNGELPENHAEARRLKIRASCYTILNGVLYKKGYYAPLLRCLNSNEADYALWEIHEGICGNHSGERSLAHKVLRQRYYWLTIQHDSRKLVQRCNKCQRFAAIPRQPPEELTPMTGPWPFA